MKKFLIIFGCFITIILTVAFLADFVISNGLRKTDLRKFQAWNDIYSSKIKSDVVIVGSSRAWMQYDTYLLDSIVGLDFYNLGIDGNPINYQLIRYNTYRRFCRKPKIVIQNIDLWTLASRHDGYEKEQYFPFVFDDSLMSEVEVDKKISFLDKKLPLIRYYGYHELVNNGFFAFFGKKYFIDGGLYKGFRSDNYIFNSTMLNKMKVVYYDREPKAIQLFEHYLAKCKKEKIQVIFVSAPVYIAATRKIYDLEGMKRMYSDIASKYNIKILDYTSDSICYNKSFFSNATHLNKFGAKLFSIKLAFDLKNILK